MFTWKFWLRETEEPVVPVVKAAEPVAKDISEPVTSFIKTFTENPRRFKLEKHEERTTIDGIPVITGDRTIRYTFTDLMTGEEWKYRAASCYQYDRIYDCDWMTDDENSLITYTIVKYYSERAIRLATHRNKKYRERQQRERDRLTKIYKGE